MASHLTVTPELASHIMQVSSVTEKKGSWIHTAALLANVNHGGAGGEIIWSSEAWSADGLAGPVDLEVESCPI